MTRRMDSNEVKRLYLSGWTVWQIARHLGFTYAGIRIRLVRDGVKIREERALKFDVGLLRELYVDKKMSPSETMHAMGASYATFYRLVKQAGIELRSGPKLDADEIRRLYTEQNWTMQQIARHFGVSDYRVKRLLIKKGVPIRGRDNYKYHPTKTKELYTVQKLSPTKIADATGASRSTVWRHLKRSGEPLRRVSSDGDLV